MEVPLWESGGPGDLSQSLLVSKFHYSVILLKRSNTCNNAHSFRGQASGNVRNWYIALNLKGKNEEKGSSQAWKDINYYIQIIMLILLER